MERRLARAIAYDILDGELIFPLLLAKKGYWQNPQGGIDPGESAVEAAIRETREETGFPVLHVNTETRTESSYRTERKGKEITTVLTAYAVRVDASGNFSLSPEDGHLAGFKATYDQAVRMLTRYPEQLPIFNETLSRLRIVVPRHSPF
jgi:8-oxo-dGTP pyrophosphatase MutT (NUDIX family)